MSEALVLIAGDAPDAPMAWARVDAQGRIAAQGMSDDAPPPATAPARTALVLPGADARLVRLDLPARSEAQARAGAQAMLGGALAGGEAIHYAVGETMDAAGARLVVAIGEARLTQWLERCRAWGTDPHLVALDCTLWPAPAGEVVVAAHPGRVIVAGGERGGFSIEPALAAPLLARWLKEARTPPQRVVFLGEASPALREAAASAGAPVEVRAGLDPVEALAQGASQAPAFAPNLRQGAFAPAGREQQPLRLWRFAALLAAAAIMLQIGSQAIQGLRDRQAAAQTMAAAERDFRAARPDVQRVVNLRAQVAALSIAMEQSTRHPVIVVSAPLNEARRQQPLVRIDEVRHEAPGRSVRLRLSAPQQPPIEAAIAALRAQGLGVEVRSTQALAGRYGADLTVEAP